MPLGRPGGIPLGEPGAGHVTRRYGRCTEVTRDRGTMDRVTESIQRARATTASYSITMRIHAGTDPAVIRELIEERSSWSRGKLDRYERVRDHLLGGRTEEEYLREADRVGPYLTLMAGITFEEENLRWCERVLAILKQRVALG